MNVHFIYFTAFLYILYALYLIGYDEESNPFAGTSVEYTRKKEEQMEQKRKKKLSAKRQQINKDNELWERNRMLTSGVVHAINVNEEYDEVYFQYNIVHTYI